MTENMNIFELITSDFGTHALYLSFVVMFFGGFAKGVVGFALPMIAVSGIGSLMTAELAILALLLPGLITNVWQAFRAGFSSAYSFLRKYWPIFVIMPITLAIAAQIFTLMSENV